jgi:hypothetical protein
MQLTPLARKFASFLEEAWDKNRNDPWHYTKALGSKFIEFVCMVEMSFKTITDRIVAIEQAIGAAQPQSMVTPQNGANGGPPPPVTQEQAAMRAQMAQIMGQQQQQQGAQTSTPQGMVRVGGDGTPLSAEEQRKEEAADMQLYGKLDMSRYKPVHA